MKNGEKWKKQFFLLKSSRKHLISKNGASNLS